MNPRSVNILVTFDLDLTLRDMLEFVEGDISTRHPAANAVRLSPCISGRGVGKSTTHVAKFSSAKVDGSTQICGAQDTVLV